MKFPAWLAIAGAILLGSTVFAADPSDRQRYLDLLAKKQRAERLNAIWKLEAELSTKRTAYAVLDLSERKLYFKVRGRAFKAIPFQSLEATRGGHPVDPDELAFRAFTLELKEGKGVETETIQRKTLSEEEKRAAGRDAEDDGPVGAEQGAVEGGAGPGEESGGGATPEGQEAQGGAQKMPGVAGGEIPPDPPPKYHMGFDGSLSIWVISDVPSSARAARYEPLLALARRVGERIAGATGESGNETKITARLPLPLAQQIFRQLLPGQRLLITP